MTEPSKPGWYPRPDMQDTLGFWDGSEWTDQTQPARVTEVKRKRTRMVAIAAAAAVLVGVVVYASAQGNDDAQCGLDRMDAALAGEQPPDCD